MLFITLAALLVNCSSNQTPTVSVAPVAPVAPVTQLTATIAGTLQLKIAVPQKKASSATRATSYVSAGTQSVTVVVTPAAGTPAPPTLIGCSSGTCSGTVTAPPGTDSVSVNLYDAPGGTGHLLSTGTSSVYVSAHTTNTINITLNGVVSTLNYSAPSFTVFQSASSPIAVTAFDAAGGTISGTFANPITVAVSDSAATISAGTTQLNSSSDSLTLSYNGNPDPAGATITFSAAGATPFAPTLVPSNFTQSFTGPNLTNWSNGTGGTACLTAGNGAGSIPACAGGGPGGITGTLPDPAGNGALRLTSNAAGTTGYVIYLPAFPTQFGLVASFDSYTYAPAGCAADGMALAIFDASAGVPTTSGQGGGALGYSNSDAGFPAPGSPGIVAGYLGIGLDTYGNYSNPTTAMGGLHLNGGPGHLPETVAIRGATAGVPTNNYLIGYQVAGVPSSLPFNWESGSATRTSAVKRSVRFTLTTAAQIQVEIDSGGGFVTYIPLTSLSTFATQPALPATIRIGFSAGTGGCANIHEIQNLVLS